MMKSNNKTYKHLSDTKRLTLKRLVTELVDAFQALKKKDISLHVKTHVESEVLTSYGTQIKKSIIPILHNYGIRMPIDMGQTDDLPKDFSNVPLHEILRFLVIIIELQFANQNWDALEKGTLQKIVIRLIELKKRTFASEDELLFNVYQRALNQLYNKMPTDQETKEALNTLQHIVRKQRVQKPFKNNKGKYYCLNCDLVLYDKKQKYCHHCGQKLINDNK